MRTVASALSIMLGATVLLSTPALGVPRDYIAWDVSKDALYTEFAIHPQAVHADGVTYLAVQGASLEPHVVSYAHSTGTWIGPVQVGDNPLSRDTHGAPALLIDEGGFLHVFFGCHHSPLKHVRSRYPGDVTSWIEMADLPADATYPQPMLFSDGSIEVFFRDSDRSAGWSSSRSTDGGRTWSTPTLVLSAGGSLTWYASFQQDGDDVLATFLQLDWDEWFAGGSYGRHDVHYMERDASGQWRSADGTAITVPVRPTDPAGLTIAYDSGEDFTNGVVARRDATGRPVVLFLTGRGGGAGTYRWKVARFDGSSWTSGEICDTDHIHDTGTLLVRPGGEMDVYVVSGGSSGEGGGDRTHEDMGGAVRNFRWDGASWADSGTISPDEPGTLYNNPQVILGGAPDAEVVFTEWMNGPSISALRVFVHGDEGLVSRDSGHRASRVAGSDRFRTSIAASRRAYPAGAPTVVLATGQDYPDALAGIPLAQALGASLLLVGEGGLTDRLADEIDRLDARSAVLLGGTAALPRALEGELIRRTSVRDVERIGGSDRFATAAAIAERLDEVIAGGVEHVYIVSGADFADALSVAPTAARTGSPILLVDGAWIPPATTGAFKALGRPSATAIGGDRAVGPAVARELDVRARYGGSNRYETCAIVGEHGLASGLLPLRTVLAPGDRFPDALSGGVLANRLRARLLFTRADGLPQQTDAALASRGSETIDLIAVGGTGVLPTSVLQEARSAAWP